MARENKFRAWDGERILKDVPIGAVTCGAFLEMQNTSFVLMQYTGLKDKNGKEIYEGDILQVAKNIKYEVCFLTEDENGEVICSYGLKTWDGRYSFAIDDYSIKEGEVIGNIYENPDLIK